MMRADGVLHLGFEPPLATRSADGVFTLTLRAIDRINPAIMERWRVMWHGDEAEAFWARNQYKLIPGQAVFVSARKLLAFTNGNFAAAEVHAEASQVRLFKEVAKC
jgi:hypothetical protein